MEDSTLLFVRLKITVTPLWAPFHHVQGRELAQPSGSGVKLKRVWLEFCVRVHRRRNLGRSVRFPDALHAGTGYAACAPRGFSALVTLRPSLSLFDRGRAHHVHNAAVSLDPTDLTGIVRAISLDSAPIQQRNKIRGQANPGFPLQIY